MRVFRYVYNSGSKYTSSTIYYRYSYTEVYARGWAKIDLSEIPEGALIDNVVFKAVVSYNSSCNMFGVRLLTSDPTTAAGSTVFSEGGSGTRLFGLTGIPGDKTQDITKWVKSPSGKEVFKSALDDGWIGFGFDFESPTGGYYYGYMQGYSYYLPALEIDYRITEPGFLIPVVVKNIAPTINCKNLTITPTTINEGDIISVSNISFCDPGNDTYEAKVVIGGEYESDWFPLGGSAGAGTGSGGTMMDIGSQVTTYSGMTRGYWFKAPTDFTITGVRVPTDASTGEQSVAVLRMNTDPSSWVYSSTTNDFTTLGYWKGISGTSIINTNFFIKKDDIITILGCRSSSSVNSYGESLYKTKIGSYDVTLTRAGMQYNLYSTAPQNIWTEISYNIGRIEMYYVIGPGKPWGVFGPGCHNVNQTINVTIPDDHPSTGTSWDNVPISVVVRDDDDHQLIPNTGIGPIDLASTITSSSYYSYMYPNSRKMAINKDYSIAVIYENYQSSPYQVSLAKSIDNGLTWEHFSVSNLPHQSSSYKYYPAMSIDSNGILHAVWQGNGMMQYANSNDGGESWSNHYNVTTSGYGYYPAIAVDKNDNVHMVWYGYTSSTPYRIFYRARASDGTWGSLVQLSEGNIYSYNPTIDSDSKGNVHVAWYGYLSTSTSYYNIRHRMLSASTNKWSSINNVTSDTSYYKYTPNMAIDSQDNVHLVWYGVDTTYSSYYNIMYAKWTASTSSWGAREYITKITTSSPYMYYPSIAVNQLDEIDVMWWGYQSPNWVSPYAIHHAERVGTSWKIDWNYIQSSSTYQYNANLLYQRPNNLAKNGFAFIWFDNTNVLRYWTSEDFEYGKPKFTDGIDFCNSTVKVNNVAPKFDLKSIYTIPTEVKEQEPFTLHAEFEDPAAGAATEDFEYNIEFEGGSSSGWKKVTEFKEGQPEGLTEIEYQPDAEEGLDTWTYGYSSYQNYNYGIYTYVYMGKTSTSTSYNYVRRGFIKFDLSGIPSGYNISKATMYLNFAYRYTSVSSTEAHWYAVNESWVEGTKSGSTADEGELTWSNLPGYDTAKEVSSLDWESISGETEWNLDTTIVQDWIDNPTSNHGMASYLDVEAMSPYYGYGYFYSSDYSTSSMRPKLVLEFKDPLPAILPRGIIEAQYFVEDDHPETGTPWDLLNFSVEVRDDDLGSDDVESSVTVNNVPPEIIPGTVLPNELVEKPDVGIPEGTVVTLDGFEFDDVAYDVPTERDYGFNYSVDWGDGEVTTWDNDFAYTGDVGGSSGGGALEDNIATLATPSSSGGGSGTYGPASMNDLNTANMCWVSSSGSPNSNYFQLTWDKKYTIAKIYVIIHGSWSSSTNRHLDACDVQYRVGTTWYTDSRLTSIPGDFEYEFKAPQTTDAIRLYNLVTTGSQASNPCVYEWYVYPGSLGGIINEDVKCSASAYTNGRKMVMNSDNNMFTVFVDNTSPYQISIANSSDFGETWMTNAVTSASSAQLDPSVVIDSSDVIHVLWRGLVSGVYNIRYANSADNGKTWGGAQDITIGTSSPSEFFAPAIAVDSDDTVHIVWYGRDATNTAKYNIYYTSRSSTGSWGSVEMLTSDTSDMYHQYPAIAIDSNDDVHVVWSGQTSTASVNNIQYMIYDSSADTWSSVKMLTSSSSNNNNNPSLAVDDDDNLHIVWSAEPSPNTIKYIKYNSGTSTWSSVEDVTSNSDENINPSIGVDHRGYVYVAWTKPDQNQINMSMNDGRYWLSEFELTSTSVFTSTVDYANIIYGGKHSLAGRGVCLVFTAANESACNLHFGITTDYNQTDIGPWKGLPMKRIVSHYVFAVVVLTLYGGQV